MMNTSVLVVDDDADIAQVLCDRLESMGHTIRSASDGEAALTAIRQELPVLVFLDVQMPKMSGLDALRQIRKEWPELPVIVMTAHGTVARAVEAMKEGATDFITKPFEMDQLKSVIAKALERKALSGEVVRLLGDISHDIKNLLTPVVCGAELLESEIDDLVDRLPEMDAVKAQASHKICDEVIGMLRDTATRVQERTKEIADYMKGVSSPLRLAPCRIADVAASVYKTLRLVLDERKISLRTEGLEQLPSIQADAGRLYNAFYNLVNNAIPEVHPGGSITIRGENKPDSSQFHLWITDTGRGMPPDVRDRLFTNDAISLKPDGTGLGTRIVKDVIDAHGGSISVESGPGKGTTFSIMLPYHPPGVVHHSA
jgi:signal transduction histidine kinase